MIVKCKLQDYGYIIQNKTLPEMYIGVPTHFATLPFLKLCVRKMGSLFRNHFIQHSSGMIRSW